MDTKLITNTNDIICPHCLHKHSNPLEFYRCDTDDNNECTYYECDNCREEFGIERYIAITYTTWIIEPDTFENHLID